MRVESNVTADHTRNQVVWRMTPEVAEFYANEINAGDDTGMKEDVAALMRAVEELEEL